MLYILICLSVVLWLAVSRLCVNYFNDYCGNDDWDKLPLKVRLPMLIFAPVWFIYWSR